MKNVKVDKLEDGTIGNGASLIGVDHGELGGEGLVFNDCDFHNVTYVAHSPLESLQGRELKVLSQEDLDLMEHIKRDEEGNLIISEGLLLKGNLEVQGDLLIHGKLEVSGEIIASEKNIQIVSSDSHWDSLDDKVLVPLKNKKLYIKKRDLQDLASLIRQLDSNSKLISSEDLIL